ncbi:MAG: thioredoxin family protein [Spirochaetales bacterium]|nr:thioredoxin family protein [Spirochaetales bacterium]
MSDRNHTGVVTAVLLVAVLVLSLAAAGCWRGGSAAEAQVDPSTSTRALKVNDAGSADSPLVTFVELGSERCIPCVKMQEVMKQMDARYGEQVRIVFHDVWTPEGEPYARQYRIRVIPTQVFLDSQGQEYYRHEGYVPFAQVAEILALKGVG